MSVKNAYLTVDAAAGSFHADIADELRLFGLTVLSEPSDSIIISVTLSTNGFVKTALATISGAESPITYEYSQPYPTDADALEIKRIEKRTLKIAVFRALRELMPGIDIPWGSLTGIRPTHLLAQMEDAMGEAEAKLFMLNEFDVTRRKYELAKQIITVQKPYVDDVGERDIDVYVGIPYCKSKCLYCSFASAVRTPKTDMGAYISALKKDISLGARLAKENGFSLRSVYFGGGTPTVLSNDELSRVLEHTLNCYGGFGRELTVEAGRPDTITGEKLQTLKSFGVTRISINPQTMNDETLRLVGRNHSAQETEQAYFAARELGFVINMDVIACLPTEDMAAFTNTLNRLKALSPDNLTVHTLAIKRASELSGRLGEFAFADAAAADDMVSAGYLAAAEMGMQPYYMYRQKYMRGNLENVGYAKAGLECIYNIDMMEETASIMAHGAGSMSKRIYSEQSLRVERIPNPKDIATYIAKVDAVFDSKAELFR